MSKYQTRQLITVNGKSVTVKKRKFFPKGANVTKLLSPYFTNVNNKLE